MTMIQNILNQELHLQKKDVIEAKTEYSGELYEYIETHFLFNIANSVMLNSNDFGGTKVYAYYTVFNLHRS